MLGMSSAAHALDWSGYFRAGPGLTSNSASRACYGLNGGSSGMKYRLGNECDLYGEFMLSQDFTKDGLEYKVSLMTNHDTGNTATEPGPAQRTCAAVGWSATNCPRGWFAHGTTSGRGQQRR